MELEKQSTSCRYCGSPSQGQAYCCDACEVLHQQIVPQNIQTEHLKKYSHLDQPEVAAHYHFNNRDFDYLFYAEGLHCSSCVHLLEKLPSFDQGVQQAKVNFGHSTVAISTTSQASLSRIAAVIEELGYKPTLLSPAEDLEEMYRLENRQFLNRIAVAGAVAGNMMLFVIPVYAGLVGTWAQIFNWISFALFLPILFYSATPFYRGAWNSLKYRVINVDLPIAIALLSSTFLSTYNLINQQGAIYFDSTASFIFFILSARYLLKRVQQKYLTNNHLSSLLRQHAYRTLEGQLKHAQDLRPNDVITLDEGQTVPTDATLLSDLASFDLSLYSGESLPKVFHRGQTIYAGFKALDLNTQLHLTSTSAQSKLGSLFKNLESGVIEKTKFVSLTDRLAQQLILVVFVTAAVFFAVYSQINFQEAFDRALALIVLACPCALAFGSPLTFGLALKKAQKLGILVKDGTSLERILDCKNFFFDKTGTLTTGELQLSTHEPLFIEPELKSIILGLEARSYHPVAFALRQAWGRQVKPAHLDQVAEILGQGIDGQIGTDIYSLRTLSESLHEDQMAIEVKKNQKTIARLYFTDPLRDDSQIAVEKLSGIGSCSILSGDLKSRCLSIAKQVGISPTNVHAELFPEDKLHYIEKQKHTCMIGDGANDSLALKRADVGIAVRGSIDLSLQSADIYFTRGGLAPLIDLIQLSHNTKSVLTRNLSISLVYNFIGATLALLGYIDPLAAAVLMPISSAVIIFSSLWGFRK